MKAPLPVEEPSMVNGTVVQLLAASAIGVSLILVVGTTTAILDGLLLPVFVDTIVL